MKKIVLSVILLSVFLGGCSSKIVRNPDIDKKVVWEYKGVIPAQTGYNENIGVSGMMYGTKDNLVVIGGGENFPEKTLLETGSGKLYSDIYVFNEKKDNLELKEHINIDREIGFGASVTDKDGIYYIGGSNKEDEKNDILFFTFTEDGNIKYEKIGELPFSFERGNAVKRDNKLYIFAGIQDGKPSNDMYEYNLLNGEIRKLSSIPGGKGRIECIAQILNDELYVFSGGDTIAYTDGYKYNFKSDKWTEVSPVRVNNEDISLLGASSVKLNDKELIVIGGKNKEVYDEAVKKLGTLRGQELIRFKAEYFEKNPTEYNRNREILVYNAEENSWKSIGAIPFDVPCNNVLILKENRLYSIGGEIKPKVNTNKIYEGTILKK